AVFRALLANYEAGEPVQGGSTLTQQLVKMLYLTPERTIARKFREAGGAWALEEQLSKDEILELYLNRIYLGSGAYGVDGAAQVYFGKSAREVTLAEAAMLAALTRAPSTFTPRRDLGAAQQRSKIVLDIMLETGKLSEEEVARALAAPAEIVDRSEILERAYYFDATAEEVKKLLPNASGDLIVHTSFDLRMQQAARAALNEVLEEQGSTMKASQAALVSMSPDGAVHAIIGGRNYVDSPFNRATQARRQPGSSFKPFVYLAALEHGLRPSDVRSGGPVNIRGYRPRNYGGRNWGYLTLENALRHSVNTVAVRIAREVGVPRVAQTAKRLGINTPLHSYPSLPLGTGEVSPYEMTGAFAAFANGGLKAEPYSVLKILNPKGETLYERGSPQPERVIVEEMAETMNTMLYRVVEAGTGRRARITEHEIAGKTGTSSDWRDAWFVGYTSHLVTGVWVGNDDFTPMRRVTGGSLPAQIWNDYMREALEPFAPEPLKRTLPRRSQRYAANSEQNGSSEIQSLPEVIRGGNRRDEAGSNERDRERTLFGLRQPPLAQQTNAPPDNRRLSRGADPRNSSQGYWSGNTFYQRENVLAPTTRPTTPRPQTTRPPQTTQPSPRNSNNPYEQEWYLREQAARNGYAYNGRPNTQISPNQSNPQRYDAPTGPIYSMEPVGR
ncbi:MAG: transglycosylase domain-containing protein, partial [Alphaproteobacteria bacterium]